MSDNTSDAVNPDSTGSWPTGIEPVSSNQLPTDPDAGRAAWSGPAVRAVQLMLLRDVQNTAHKQHFLLALTAQVDDGTAEFRQQWGAILDDIAGAVQRTVALAEKGRVASSDITRALDLGAKGLPWHIRPASPSLALFEQALNQRAEIATGAGVTSSDNGGQVNPQGTPSAETGAAGRPIGEAIDTALPEPDHGDWQGTPEPPASPQAGHVPAPEPGNEP
ncbi:hypothetical protein [Nocardia transvalensis]|uniref:hypothetical protein n=1 Tax=Nocardia transvalensis TaxID=37333 RepID=UPI00189466BF|nr:hypothetical protein [Nocardia transvalensis]MBF6331822.1 hypothetical protein [Nocardia transvalensis]